MPGPQALRPGRVEEHCNVPLPFKTAGTGECLNGAFAPREAPARPSKACTAGLCRQRTTHLQIAPVPQPSLERLGHDHFGTPLHPTRADPRGGQRPFGRFAQPIRLTQPMGNGLPRSFIACTRPASSPFGQFADEVHHDPTWDFHELATGHNAMIIAPALSASRLLGLGA
jgi:hypothetical protein